MCREDSIRHVGLHNHALTPRIETPDVYPVIALNLFARTAALVARKIAAVFSRAHSPNGFFEAALFRDDRSSSRSVRLQASMFEEPHAPAGGGDPRRDQATNRQL